MRSMYNLNELAAEITRQAQTKKDYIAQENSMHAISVPDDGGIRSIMLDIDSIGQHSMTGHAHSQLATHLRIPRRYYDMMRTESPDLLCTNINHWLTRNDDNQRLVRVLDGQVRGILSTSYKPLDNYDFAEIALTEINNIGGINVQASAVTDTRMYIKAVNERMQGEIRKGDIVQWGISLSNSEVGSGSLRIDPLVFRLVCTNGAVAREAIAGYVRRHKGRRLQSDLEVSQLLSDEARQADDKAFWLGIRDLIRNIFNPDNFQQLLAVWQASTEREITQNAPITNVVAVTLREHKLPDSMADGVLKNLLRADDLTQYGLGNAITRHSQDVDDYTVADNMEQIGATILSYDDKKWSRLNNLAMAMSE